MDRVPVAFELVTAPATEPVSIDEAKAQCRVSGTDEDTTLTSLISVAREKVEADSERALITQTRQLWIDRFPCDGHQIIDIACKPITSITSVMHVDAAGDWQTVSSANYVTDLISAPARIQPVTGLAWPVARIQVNAVKVLFVCGGANAAAVPAMAKHAMKLLIGHWFENREAVGKVPDEIALGYWSLIEGIKWH